MAMTYDEFVKNINECLELDSTIDRHHDPEEKAAMNERFVELFSGCMAMGRAVLQSGKLSPEAEERLKKQLGKLNLALPRYEAQRNLRTKNAVKSNKSKDEEPTIGRAA